MCRERSRVCYSDKFAYVIFPYVFPLTFWHFLLLQIHAGHGDTGAIHAIHTGEAGGVTVDLSNVTEATLNQEGQLILTGDDGQSKICN